MHSILVNLIPDCVKIIESYIPKCYLILYKNTITDKDTYINGIESVESILTLMKI